MKGIKLKRKNEVVYPVPYFPIGSIYMTVVDTNPSTLFGGTWTRIAKGRTLVGVDENDTDFNVPQKTGGEKKHKLTINEMPRHKHKSYNKQDAGSYTINEGNSIQFTSGAPFNTWGSTLNMDNEGGDQEHNNIQPYFTCYIWCRTA